MAPKLDYSHLMSKRTYKLADVKNRIEKVAWDTVRFTDSDSIDELWEIKHGEDGDYIVALYDDSQVKTASLSTKSDWDILTENNNVFVFYKRSPIAKLALASLGIPSEEVSLMKSYLPKKLASSKELRTKLLNNLSQAEKTTILKQFPELI